MRGFLDRLWFRRSRPPRILLIDDYVPDRSIGAGVPRMAELLRSMGAAGAKVYLWPVLGILDGGRRADMYGASLVRGAGVPAGAVAPIGATCNGGSLARVNNRRGGHLGQGHR